MNITKESWDRLKGQTEWKDGKPGGPLIHTACGGSPIYVRQQSRSVWEEGFKSSCGGRGDVVVVGELYCTKCHSEPTTTPSAPIYPSEFFDPEEKVLATA